MEIQEQWKIDVERSTLRFGLRHKLLGEIGGQLRCWGGRVMIDEANPRKAAVRIWADISSIDTGSRNQDDAILHTELFDQRSEPALEFDGERLEVDDANRLTLTGWLCLHTFRKKIPVVVDAYTLEIDASGRPRFVCSARASIDRKALGLHKQRGVGHWLSDQLLAETIDIVAHVEATLEDGVDASPPMTLTALRSWIGPRATSFA